MAAVVLMIMLCLIHGFLVSGSINIWQSKVIISLAILILGQRMI